jgi:hypothetical protein
MHRVSSQTPPVTAAAPARGKGEAQFLAGDPFVGKSAQVRAIGHKQSAGIALSVALKPWCIPTHDRGEHDNQ